MRWHDRPQSSEREAVMNANDGSRHGRENDGRMRITDQFRDRGSMVYDLKGCGLRLSLRVSERSDSRLRWEIAASAKVEAPFPTLTAIATTRREALAGLARAWAETQ